MDYVYIFRREPLMSELQDDEKATAEDIDIFNHRSSSRLNGNQSRCKSQPNSLEVHDPIWISESKLRERKSLSPNTLRGYSTFVSDLDKSLFDPQAYQTLYLPGGGNKPLDPMAVSAVHRTIVDTEARILAVHLTYLDLSFFGLLTKDNLAGGGDLKRLSDPDTWRFRLDIVERFLCLRTFVEVTVLAASNLRESARVLCKWIQVAEEAERRLRNLFGFVCLVSALRSSILQEWKGLWIKLQEEHCNEYKLLMEELVMTCRPSAGVTVPNVMPYVIEALMAVEETSSIIEDLNQTLISDALAEPKAQWTAMLDSCKQNAQVAFCRVSNFDDLLLDLFRTEFHIRLFWGSNGVSDYPHNFNERHSKFAKVLSALATICARQY